MEILIQKLKAEVHALKSQLVSNGIKPPIQKMPSSLFSPTEDPDIELKMV